MMLRGNRVQTAVWDYFVLLVPPIFFGTVIFFGSVFIPLQIVTVIAAVGLLWHRIPSNVLVRVVLWLSVVLGLLLLGTLLASEGELGADDYKQLAIRSLFAVYTSAVFMRLQVSSGIAPSASRAALITLRILFLYGLYELLAKIFDLPLPLSFLINNPSYSNAIEVTSELSGWLGFYRSQSIWPEPSFVIFPIILFWVLSDGEKKPISKMDVIIMILFSIFTFSRTVWIGLFLIILMRIPIFRRHAIAIAVILAFFFSLALLNVSSDVDHSAYVRAETTYFGFEIASNDFYRGIGFNKFKDTNYSKISGENVIHNTVSNYVASMGWPIGVLLLLFLLTPILFPGLLELSYLAPLAVVLIFTTSDAFYFTPVYFIIAYGRAKNISLRSVVSCP
jgi:hypothetical protein